MTPSTSLEKFYQETASLVPEGISQEIGHFNVFNVKTLIAKLQGKPSMPYNRRTYYKISLIIGNNRAEYADKVINIKNRALLFATPHVPYHYVPQDTEQSGHFCIFTEQFLTKTKSGIVLEELPIFQPQGFPIFDVSTKDSEEILLIFEKMHKELASDYHYKYDLLRNYVVELIHFGQKLQPTFASHPVRSASHRIASLFAELLERQFPIEFPHQRLKLRTANAFAERLAVHVNHLNKVLKEQTGHTTTKLINGRILQEAKILLKHSDRSVSEIAYSLGFEELSYFSNFFKKQTTMAPIDFRR